MRTAEEALGVSVCVPTHAGRGRMVGELLATMPAARRAAGEPVQVIVVDDSDEPECTELEHRCQEAGARYLRGPRSVAQKRNLAAEHASLDVILFVDSDCLLTEDSLREHLRALRSAPGDVAGAVGRTVMFGKVNRVWEILDYSRLYNTCFDFAELYRRVGWGVTCNLSVRREVFWKLGGFAQDIFTLVGGEDVDFGIRATERGYRWITAPRATVLHRRDPITRLHQVLRKLFTYGQADVFLTARRPRRRILHPNPFTISLLTVLGTLPALGRWPALPFTVALAPHVVTILANGSRRREHDTLYGARLVRGHRRVGNAVTEFLRRVRGAVIDEAFDAGVLWEALRRGQPHLSVYHFAYANETEFVRRGAVAEGVLTEEPRGEPLHSDVPSSTPGSELK